MNVLVLATLTEATGNAVTARRIARQLSKAHCVTLADSAGATLDSLQELARARRFDCAVGLHALLAGPFLRALGLPYALVLGGTDLYEPAHALQFKQMTRAVEAASLVIAFSPENRARAEELWPSTAGHILCLPQAVDVDEVAPFDLRAACGLYPAARLALLPASLRQVKDPLHLVDAFSRFHSNVDASAHLVICGAPLEPAYAANALRLITQAPGVHYLPALSRPRMLGAIRQADLLLNTSVSEGMCGTVLEAMALGTPVIARANSGNRSLVREGETGFLYDAPHEALERIQRLLNEPELGARIAARAARYAREWHGADDERAVYERVVSTLAHRRRQVVNAEELVS